MKTTLLSLICPLPVLLALGAPAASPYGDGFSSGDPGDYVEGFDPTGQIRIEPRDGTKALVISGTSTSLNPVPVTAGQAFRLCLDASFHGEVESIEDNPRFAIFAMPSERSPVLPRREIRFLDRAGKPTGGTLISSMPFRRSHTYVDEFHVPADAVALRLRVASGNGVTLSLTNLLLEKITDPDTLNLNPGFGLGPFNYSGWKTISGGGRLLTIEGQTIFDSKYGSRGRTFPLAGPGTYALSAKATGNGYNATVHLDVFDADGKNQMRATLRRFDEPNYFVVPKGARSASLLVYSCLLEEVRVARVGDDDAIDTLRKQR